MNPEYNEPQMNADKRRYLIATDFSKIIHHRVRKERKAARQESLCPLCSPWLNAFSAPAHGRAAAACACRSSADKPRGGMSMEGGRMTEIGEMPEEREDKYV